MGGEGDEEGGRDDRGGVGEEYGGCCSVFVMAYYSFRKSLYRMSGLFAPIT